MLFWEHISLGFVLYLSSGDVLAVAVLVRFCRVPCRLPFGKVPLPFLTLVKGEDIRQQNSGDVLDLMLRDAAVVGKLFSPAQVAPPKKYFAAAFSRAAEEWRLERLLPSVPLFPSHPSPFLSGRILSVVQTGRGALSYGFFAGHDFNCGFVIIQRTRNARPWSDALRWGDPAHRRCVRLGHLDQRESVQRGLYGADGN